MIQALLYAIPTAISAAKKISDYYKTKKQTLDTSAQDRFISSIRSQSANSNSANQAKSNLARGVRSQLSEAQSNLETAQAQSGISNSPFSQRANLELEQNALGSLAQGTAQIEAQNMQQQDVAKQRIQEARLNLDLMKQQFNQQKKQQESELLTGIAGDVAGMAAQGINAYTQNKQQSQMMSALTDEYTQRGLDTTTIAGITQKYSDNPELAQKLLESKANYLDLSTKVPAMYNAVSYAFSDEQKKMVESATNPNTKLDLIKIFSNDPEVQGKLSARQKLAYQNEFIPSLVKQAQNYKINTEGLNYDQLNTAIEDNDVAFKQIQGLSPDQQKELSVYMQTMSPRQALNQYGIKKEFTEYSNYLNSYSDSIRNDSRVKNISKAVSSGLMTARDAKSALDEIQQGYKSTGKPEKQLTQGVDIKSAQNKIAGFKSVESMGEYYNNFDKDRSYRTILSTIGKSPSQEDISKAYTMTSTRLNQQKTRLNQLTNDLSQQASPTYKEPIQKEINKVSSIVNNLENILNQISEMDKASKSYLKAEDPNNFVEGL